MDLMNAAKYMSPVWVAKAPAMMHSQPSQPITIPAHSASEPSRASSAISAPDSVKPTPQPKPVDNPEQASAPTKEQEEKQQQQALEQVIAQLKSRDQEVRTHEQAHLAAAGPYARGGISYDYQTGPDGQKYAVGGSVGIDTSPVSGDPEATIQKMMVVQRAALAPAQPSAQDFKVASQASQMQAQARAELQAERMEDSAVEEASAPDSLNAPAVIESESSDKTIAVKEAQPTGAIAERNAFDLRLQLQNVAA
ncbi:putative metalloprotease CJM1_0395 family protein [Thiomicrospira microaerophila]|uniref:putative metalloprotease CJM1_0395 family protein n=1 Tax=Thiomicrospira microaerophila TaxID=406020 RepID=UPI000698D7C6|nr:putative metalloprotease CJM1_0395 family protein [Thiomicrospira microaerophila]